MDNLDKFIAAAENAVLVSSLGTSPTEAWQQVKQQESELRTQWAELNRRPSSSAATMRHVKTAQELRNKQVFRLDFAGGGSSFITSWYELAKRLGIKEATIAVYLSKGGGLFHIKRFNPLIEQDDVLTVSRMIKEKDPKPRRGRPPKYEVDLGRMGIDYVETQNRRTDDAAE